MVRTVTPHPFMNVETETQEDEIVYVLQRDGKYKQVAHRVRRITPEGHAVTYCTIWCRTIVVGTKPEDCFTWCENGCKPIQTEAN